VSGFVAALDGPTPILTDGGIETRVMFEAGLPLDPHVGVARMLGESRSRAVLRGIYSSYVTTAREHALPLVLGTPTFRASPRWVEAAGLPASAVATLNADAVAFDREIVASVGHRPVFIAGVVGPAGDAYTPGDCLGAQAAERYHRAQVDALAHAGVDFLFAPTFPAVAEALGAARALGATTLPYVVSWVLGADGRVLDGTALHDAVARLDDETVPAPLYHALNCVHPTVAHRSIAAMPASVRPRVRELKANGCALTPAELVRLDHAVSDPPDDFADAMVALRADFGLQVLGGCCGTDDRHMRALGTRLGSALA